MRISIAVMAITWFVASVASQSLVANSDEPLIRLANLIKLKQRPVTNTRTPLLRKDNSVNVPFTDIIKVFEADAYFKGKWSTNKISTPDKLFNGFINQNGESVTYFQVDNLESRATTVVAFFADEVILIHCRNISIPKVHFSYST